VSLDIAPPPQPQIDAKSIADLGFVPVTVLGDELNRCGIMHAALRPLRTPVRFAGLALTVECMVGDNSALHYALDELVPGPVIVADARGHTDTAVWGEILHTCAQVRGAAAVVIDGAMRDVAAIANSSLPAYCRGICARGPHKGWGGSVNRKIQCAGVAVSPADLVVGDHDGIIVIGPSQVSGLLERCQVRLAKEAEILRRVAAGEPTTRALGLPPHDRIGR
jgi:4-hydroxy-4-methyl-2-oxoglutarate aldolase